MDLVDTLRKKIDLLEEGEHTQGLEAVLLHIKTAFRHLSRGQESDDDTAFTDAIYRTNQAFEGSIKEAFRVLTGQNPAKKTPNEIESYLEQKDIFRNRVLNQLTTYRTEWRNPSTHDYKLDFDESEAFLAIVTVSAFACLLFDQITEQLAYKRSQAETEAQKGSLAANLAKTLNADLLSQVANLLTEFCARHMVSTKKSSRVTEPQVVGALHGFISSAAPDLEIQTQFRLDAGKPFRADILVTKDKENVVIELKHNLVRLEYQSLISQFEKQMVINGIKSGVLLLLPDGPKDMKRTESFVNGINGRLVVLLPQNST
jgi:hypothetical protein